MWNRQFLEKIAKQRELTKEQTDVFLAKLSDYDHSDIQIAEKLSISKDTVRNRMSGIYKKFCIGGKGTGKYSRLLQFLTEECKNFIALDISITETLQKQNPVEYEGALRTNQPNNLECNSIKPNRERLRQKLTNQNLPAQYPEFIGRQQELSDIMKFLSPNHGSNVITVDGIGGVGKTALVLEAAYRCLEARLDSENSSEIPIFDAIIFTSAKADYLLPIGITPRLDRQHNLRDIFRVIADTLKPTGDQKQQNITAAATFEEQLQRVRESLSKQRTLLIVDNLETIEDKSEVLAFLHDLFGSVKSIITTREQSTIHVHIRLDCLPDEDSMKLIQQQLVEKQIELSNENLKCLHEATTKIPIVIMYTVGRLANSSSLETVLKDLKSADGDVARFCFEKSVGEIKGKAAHNILMALAIFHEFPVRESVTEVSGLKTAPRYVVNEGLETLKRISLVRQQEDRYIMLALTREYALAELAAHPDFEKQVLERWINWYLEFAQKYGRQKPDNQDNTDNHHIHYDILEKEWGNLLAVLHWCAAQGRYKNVKELWQHLRDFTRIYGYWKERIFWTDWLAKASVSRAEWSMAASLMSKNAYTLTLRGSSDELIEAETLLKQALDLFDRITVDTQLEVAFCLTELYIRYKNYEQARNWLHKQEELFKNSNFLGKEYTSHLIYITRHQAELCYAKKDYSQAKNLYQNMENYAKEIDWQRYIMYAQGWMADTAIMQNQLDEAERLLKVCLPEAERLKDKWRIACYQAFYARLEKARGNSDKAQEWGNKAINGFQSLDMIVDAEETRVLLND
jgi:LuxR family glucitol operon transcriptional activator